jgi:hypothetical protein
VHDPFRLVDPAGRAQSFRVRFDQIREFGFAGPCALIIHGLPGTAAANPKHHQRGEEKKKEERPDKRQETARTRTLDIGANHVG